MYLYFIIKKYFGIYGFYIIISLFLFLVYNYGLKLDLVIRIFIWLIPFFLYKYLWFLFEWKFYLVKNEENFLVKWIEKGYIKEWMVKYIYWSILFLPWNWIWLLFIGFVYNWWIFKVWINGNKDIFFKKYFGWDCRNFFFYFHYYILQYIYKIFLVICLYPIWRSYYLLILIKKNIVTAKYLDLLKVRIFIFIWIYFILFTFNTINITEFAYGFLIYRVIEDIIGIKNIFILIWYIDINIILPIFFYFLNKEYFCNYIYPSNVMTIGYKTFLNYTLHLSYITSIHFKVLHQFICACNYKFNGYFFKNFSLISTIIPNYMEFIVFTKINSDFNLIYDWKFFLQYEKCYGQSMYCYLMLYLQSDLYYKSIYFMTLGANYFSNIKNFDDQFIKLFNFFGFYYRLLELWISINIIISWNMCLYSENLSSLYLKDIIYRYKFKKLFEKKLNNLYIFPFERIPNTFVSTKTYRNYLKQISHLNVNFSDITWNESLNYLKNNLLLQCNDATTFYLNDKLRYKFINKKYKNFINYYYMWNFDHILSELYSNPDIINSMNNFELHNNQVFDFEKFCKIYFYFIDFNYMHKNGFQGVDANKLL
jgi:hypothetical protein